MVTFDRSHYNMLDRLNNETKKNAVGGLVESIKCEFVNVTTPLLDTVWNKHLSAMHESHCVGDQCVNALGCVNNYRDLLYCEPSTNTCQTLPLIADLDVVAGVEQDSGRCRDNRPLAEARCMSSSECASGFRCCPFVGSGVTRCTPLEYCVSV